MGQIKALPSFWCKMRGSFLIGASQLLSEPSVGEREFIEKNCARPPKAHDPAPVASRLGALGAGHFEQPLSEPERGDITVVQSRMARNHCCLCIVVGTCPHQIRGL